MNRRHNLWVAALLLLAACGGVSSSDDRNGAAGSGVSGSGGSGVGAEGGASGSGVGAEGGTSGFGAGGGYGAEGGSAGTPSDPALDCPAQPYPTPPEAVRDGTVPALVASARFGTDQPDGIDGVALGPNGDVVVALWKWTGAAKNLVGRFTSDGVAVWTHEWDNFGGGRIAVGTDAAGNTVVGGISAQAITIAGTQLGQGNAAFLYLVAFDPDGAPLWSRSASYSGSIELDALAVSATGDVAIGGIVGASVDFGGGTLEVPHTAGGATGAAFVARFDAAGAHVYSRLYTATGVYNDPPALPGAGGTDGFGHGETTDVAWASGDELVLSVLFTGSIDLGSVVLPNDGLPDGLVAKLDSAGELVWHKHFNSLMGENIPGGAGGSAGFIPDGDVAPLRADVAASGKIAVTGALRGRGRFGAQTLNVDNGGYFTVLLAEDGEVESAVPEGGIDVAFDGAGQPVAWDGSRLFAVGTPPSFSLQPAGYILATRSGQLVATGGGLLLGASFMGKLDLGEATLESLGCADGFFARY